MLPRLAILAALPVLVLALAGCAPSTPTTSSSQPGSASGSTAPGATTAPSTASTPTAAPVANPTPTAAAATGYLINGNPHHPDSSGDWFGEYAFFTDSSKTVWCEFTIFSADTPAGYCLVVPSAKSQATFEKPASASNNCDQSSSRPRDGYALGFGGNPLGSKLAGWSGCSTSDYAPAADLAKTKVLPDETTLAVAPFSCTVLTGLARCTYKSSATHSGTVTMGLTVATYSAT
jgi:hypothetical protein